MDWARGDYFSWAHPEIEFVWADGPTPGSWKGLAGMAEAWAKTWLLGIRTADNRL